MEIVTTFIIANPLLTLAAVFFLLILTIILLVKKLKKQKAYIIAVENHAHNRIAQVLREKEEAVEQANAEADRRVDEEKKHSAEELRKQREYIETQRSVLATQSEKELLIDVMLAIGTYAVRLDRLEEGLVTDQILSRINDVLSGLKNQNDMTQKLHVKLEETECTLRKELSVSYVLSAIKKVNTKLEDIENEIDGTIDDRLSSISSDLYWTKSAAEDARAAAESAQSAAEDARAAAEVN